MATIGNVCSALHSPCGSGLGVTKPLAADGALVPTELVAVTVNV